MSTLGRGRRRRVGSQGRSSIVYRCVLGCLLFSGCRLELAAAEVSGLAHLLATVGRHQLEAEEETGQRGHEGTRIEPSR